MSETLFSSLKSREKLAASNLKVSPGESLIEISINPSSLSLGAVMASVFAAEYGQNEIEKEEISLFIRGEDVLLATDWDTGTTATVDGRARPMRFRFRLAGEKKGGHNQVAWVGVKIRVSDLIVALRNKVENSELYSVLTEPIQISVKANDLGNAPGQIVILPGSEGRERTITVRGTVDQATVAELEPTTCGSRVGDLDANLLLEMGLLASEEAGVYIHPGDSANASFLAGVGARGAAVAAFGSKGPDLLTEARGSGLTKPVVASARMIKTVGFLQEPMAEMARNRVKNRVAREVARIQAAFIAACLEDTSTLGALYGLVGMPMAEKILGSAASRGDVVKAAREFADGVINIAEVAGGARIAESLTRTAQNKIVKADMAQVGKAEEKNGQEATETVKNLMMAYLAQALDPAIREQNVAVALGEHAIEVAAREIAKIPSDEALRRPDVALGAVRAAGKKATDIVGSLLSRVEAGDVAKWWSNMESYCSQLKVSEAVLSNLKGKGAGRVGELPTASAVKVPDALRAAWAEEMVTDVQGRFFAGEAGRLGAGWVDDQGISLMISDLAVQPDAAKYPLRPEQVAKILGANKSPAKIEAMLYSSDVCKTAGRVVGMTNPERNKAKQNNLVNGPLFLARWMPKGQEAVAGLKGKERWVVTPENAWVGEAAVSLPRKAGDFPIARVAEAGSLRVYGLSPDGEKQYFHVPMKAIRANQEEGAVVFALDAEQLQELAGFASNRGRETVLRLEDGLVQLSGNLQKHVALLPTVGLDRLPESLRPIAAAAGVQPKTVIHPLGEVVHRVAKMATPRLRDTIKPKVVATPGIGLRATEESFAVAGGVAVAATPRGARDLAIDDSQRRQWDRELAELNKVMTEFPTLSDKEVKALVKVKGSIGAALKDILSSPVLARQLYKSTAMGPLRGLVALLRERQLEAPDLDGEPLDLFASKQGPGKEDEVVQQAWKTLVSAMKRIRQRLKTRKQDLEMARGIQMPVVQGEVRAGAVEAQIVIESEEEVEEQAPPERKRVRV